MYTINLDCAPMTPRPDTYLPGILAGTGLIVNDFTIISKVFGNWVFELKKEKETIYLEQINIIMERIKNLYYNGCIRYGSW